MFSSPSSRFQRGDRWVQEHFVHGVGRGRSGQDPSPLAPLLSKHPGTHLCRRLQRQREDWRGQGRAHEDAGRGRAEGGSASHIRKQTGAFSRNLDLKIWRELAMNYYFPETWESAAIQHNCQTCHDITYLKVLLHVCWTLGRGPGSNPGRGPA